MSSNYPPGVTGNEYEIAGPDYERDVDEECPECGGHMIEQGYRRNSWVHCMDCDYQKDLERLYHNDFDSTAP